MRKVIIEPHRVMINLTGLAICLGLLHGISYLPIAIGLRGEPIQFFNMDSERNFAALFSTLLLFYCAGLNWYIGMAQPEPSMRRKWLAWMWVFVYLGLDESLSFHERLAWPVHRLLGGLNLYGFAWLVPYAVAGGVLALIYGRFWWSLPPKTRMRLGLGAGLYVAGGMGCELLGWILTRMEADPVFWHIEVLVEESLEMAGGIMLVMAYIDYITIQLPGVRLGFIPHPEYESTGPASGDPASRS